MTGLAEMVASGVPLAKAVRATGASAAAGCRDLLQRAASSLGEGSPLSEALSDPPGAVPHVVLAILRAAERASATDRGLAEAASLLEWEAEIRSRTRHALAYPAVILITGCGSLAVILGLVVPRFAALLTDAGATLPPLTRALVSLTKAGPGLVLPACGVAAFAVGSLFAGRTARGKRVADELMLRAPVLGPIRHGLSAARVCRSVGSMLESGMPLPDALDAAAEAAADHAVRRRLTRARRRIVEGEGIAAALAAEQVVPAQAAQIIAVGEGSGRLAPLTTRAGALLAAEAQRRMATAISLLEPLCILGFGAAIAVVAAGLLQAIYAVRPAV